MAYKCRKDPAGIKQAVTEASREAAKETAEKGRTTQSGYTTLMKAKLKPRTDAVPVKCDF